MLMLVFAGMPFALVALLPSKLVTDPLSRQQAPPAVLTCLIPDRVHRIRTQPAARRRTDGRVGV
jgi:hypothetical protein